MYANVYIHMCVKHIHIHIHLHIHTHIHIHMHVQIKIQHTYTYYMHVSTIRFTSVLLTICSESAHIEISMSWACVSNEHPTSLRCLASGPCCLASGPCCLVSSPRCLTSAPCPVSPARAPQKRSAPLSQVPPYRGVIGRPEDRPAMTLGV